MITDSKVFNAKKGVALVTVLLFMMMATIAATAVYKWLDSENKSSAARLKRSEAFQASEAGLNAARAWLAFNGNETGAMITQYLAHHQPILLDSMITPMGVERHQRFSVALTNVDTTSGSIKIKLISQGFGRDSSSYSQVAILKVEGLYQVDLPLETVTSTVNYKYAYFGGTTQYHGDHHSTSMLINGNWSGNPSHVDKDFIVTGNVELSGNNVEVKENSCIGGDFNATNGFNLGSTYIAGTASPMNGKVNGDAYFEGDVTVGNANADFVVAGNATINGTFTANPAKYTTFQKNLCLSENGRILFDNTQQRTFTVYKNVWIPGEGALGGNISLDNQGITLQILGRDVNSAMYVGGSYLDSVKSPVYYYHQEGDFWSNVWGWISGTFNWRYFVTQASTRSSVVSGPVPFACADTMKTYCDSKWKKTAGCDGSSYLVEDMLTTSYENFANNYANKGCADSITTYDNDLVTKLNSCYAQMDAADNRSELLYNGFLVVKLSALQKSDPKGTLSGKFIIIFEDDVGQQAYPPTDENSLVMLYFKKSAGQIQQTNSTAEYNYFIYTEGDISQFDGTGTWKGSIYAEAAKCAKVGGFNGGVSLEFKESVVEELSNAGVLCAAGKPCKGPASSSGSSGGSTPGAGSGGTSENTETTKDLHWIALAPTLKISLQSQYANIEEIENATTKIAEDYSLLVMPRIIYLEKGNALSSYNYKHYNVVYLGGLQPTSGGAAYCDEGSVFNTGAISETTPFTSVGLHACRYTEGNYSSKFWVWIVDAGSQTKINFAEAHINVPSLASCPDTIPVKIERTGTTKGGTLKLMVYSTANDANYIAQESSTGQFTLTELGPNSGGRLYSLTIADNAALGEPIFKVAIDDCANATGYIQFQLFDEDYSDYTTVGNPNNELIKFGDGSGRVIHKSYNDAPADDFEDKDYINSIKLRPDCNYRKNEEIKWNVMQSNGGNGCTKDKTNFDSYSGPWVCKLGSDVTIYAGDNEADYNEYCELFKIDAQVVSSDKDTVVYASLKKRAFNLHVEVVSGYGKAEVYPDKSNFDDVLLTLYSEKDSIMGTCEVGNGNCDFVVFYGEKYYARAEGRNFNKWTYSCKTLSDGGSTTCGTTTNGKIISATITENDSLFANFDKQGYCFTEDFKNLYSYCDEDVLPVVSETTGKGIGGWARFGNKSIFYNDRPYNDISKNYDYKYQYNSVLEVGHGDGKYCIDQCVTTPDYRYSQYGMPYGKMYPFFKNIHCSVEGVENIIIGEAYHGLTTNEKKSRSIEATTSYNELSIAEKESKDGPYWSYDDPPVSCEQWADSTKSPNWFPRVPIDGNNMIDLSTFSPSKNAGAGCKNNPDSLWTYRFADIKGSRNNKTERDNKNIATFNISGYDGIAPPSICPKGSSDCGSRIRGGYYSQFDEYSPWLRISAPGASQQSSYGPVLNNNDKSQMDNEGKQYFIDNNYRTYSNSNFLYKKNWNIKPYIVRDGPGAMTVATKDEWGFSVLRKHPAGYNGTYTKIFKLNATSVASDGGKTTSMVLRSNADMSSYYLLNVDPTGDSTNANHIFVCHCRDDLCYVRMATTSSSLNNQAEAMNKYTAGHCVSENSEANLLKTSGIGNYKWSYIKSQPIEIKAVLDEDFLNVTVAYSVNSAVDDMRTKIAYLQAKFNLKDAKAFGYGPNVPGADPKDDPIAQVNDNDNVYVGFTMNNKNEIIFNLDWRSGSCTDFKSNPTVYCAYEGGVAEAGTTELPVRYVFDYCPDGGDCRCEYEYSFDGGTNWISESKYRLPVIAAKYPKGRMKIRANCHDNNNVVPLNSVQSDCEGFVSVTEYGNKCYDSYSIYQTSAQKSFVFDMFNSKNIQGPDNYYVNKIDNNLTEDEINVRKEVCTDEKYPDANHWRNNGYCNTDTRNPPAISHRTDNEAFHPKENNKKKNTDMPGNQLIKIADLGTNDSPEDIDAFIQLTDSTDNNFNKKFLNLNGSTISFRLYQNKLADAIEIFLEDDNGNKTGSYEVPGVKETLNEEGNYCNVDDDVVSNSTYVNNPGAYQGYYKELCQKNLVWVRDAKRLAREKNWSNLKPWLDISFSISWLKALGDDDFDATRVSKIHFKVKNSRGGGLHIENLRADCPTALDVLECQATYPTKNQQTNIKSSGPNDPNIEINEGRWFYYTFNAPGAQECIMRMLPNGNDSYQNIKGLESLTENWWSCNSEMKLDTLKPICDQPTGECSAKIYIVAKNSSDELDSCHRSDNDKFISKTLKISNTTYKCYDFTSEPVIYDGTKPVDMGIFMKDYQPIPMPVSLVSPSGQVIETKKVENNTNTRPLNCEVDSLGRRVVYKANGKDIQTWSGGNMNNNKNCAYFEFVPEETGTYKIVYGETQIEACTREVKVPERLLTNCQSTANGNSVSSKSSVTFSAHGELLPINGKLILKGTDFIEEHSCNFDDSREPSANVVCGITAPKQSGKYAVTMQFDGAEELSCGNLVVNSKPTPTNCQVASTGDFVAKIINPNNDSYSYRLIVCKDVLGNGCEEVYRNSNSGIMQSIKLGYNDVQIGNSYVYTFEVSSNGNFDSNVESCSVNWKYSDSEIEADCRFASATAKAGGTVDFGVKNVKGLTKDSEMSLYLGDTKVGSVYAKANGMAASTKVTAPTDKGKYEYTLYYGEKKVCSADLAIEAITGACNTVKASHNSEKVESYGYGQKPVIYVNNVENLNGNTEVTLKIGNSDQNQSFTLSENGTYYEVSDIAKAGTYAYSVWKGEDKVCNGSFSIKQITAECRIVTKESSPWTNVTAVTKAVANTNVKLEVKNIQNLEGQISASFKREGGTSKILDLNTYNQVSMSGEFGTPDLNGNVEYTVYDASGGEICTTPAIEVAKQEIHCGVANDNNAPGTFVTQVNIMNSKYTPRTHFYFYTKYAGDPVPSFKVSSPWNTYGVEYDVQGDRYSSYVNGCAGHEVNGYKCMTVYPEWVGNDGFIPQTYPYHYIYYVDYSNYYGGSRTSCERSVKID